MKTPWGQALAAALALVALTPPVAGADGVRARFDLDDRRGGPFPSDRFTVADAAQKTGRRVSLAKPDCVARPNDCMDLDVINTLDGFNARPRLSIPFDGAIDVASVDSGSVFLLRLGRARSHDAHDRRGHHHAARIVGINQIVWDVATTTLHAEPDEILEQHTRYALIVTRLVRDTQGQRVQAAEAFRRFRHDLNPSQAHHEPDLKGYRRQLLGALESARAVGIAEKDVAVVSVFTTQGVTAILQKIRRQIHEGPPPRADFALGPDGAPAVYPLTTLTNLVVVRQTGTAPSFSPAATPFPALSLFAPGAIGALAFGKYESPDYLTAGRHIPPVPTRDGEPVVQRTTEVFFNLILPAGAAPPLGWPVAIYGHGGTEDKQGSMFVLAGRLAAQGIATIGINTVGRGFGPLGTLTLSRGTNPSVTLPAGGRGTDVDANGQIAQPEGHVAPAPRAILRDRDTKTQTVADLMQLVRAIESGVDVDDDGIPDLDASRIYYVGWSNGASVGAALLAVEASIRTGVLIVPAGASLEAFRLSPVFRASNVGALLSARVPSLINVGGLTFDENLPLRDQPPVVNTIAGATDIQELLDNYEWVGQAADAVAHGVYLRRAPLRGVEPKSLIIQFARGDRNLPNPTTTAVVRAGDLADRAMYYRFDLFLAANPGFPLTDPHGGIHLPPPPFVPLPAAQRQAATDAALAVQDQIAAFFASDGTVVVDPDGAGPLFETPIVPPLPEDVVFFP